jgi:magnesium-transporting ATPase (P-type)
LNESKALPIKGLILVPSLITLAVTLLRLIGELQDWSPALFDKSAGGGGALMGISWLIIVFGFYFGWRLARMGHAPASAGKAAGLALLVVLGVGVVSFLAGRFGQNAFFGAFTLGSIVAVLLTRSLWPALWRTLLAYAFAARVPVVLVMLIAIIGAWGTHYDVSPPDFPDTYSPFVKWVLIGLVPQMTIWIYLTVVGGLFFGAIAAAIARRR